MGTGDTTFELGIDAMRKSCDGMLNIYTETATPTLLTSSIVCVFHAAAPSAEDDGGGPKSGWIELMPHCDMGGPGGMAIEWHLVEKDLPPRLLEDRPPSSRGTSIVDRTIARPIRCAPHAIVFARPFQ